MFKKLSKNAVLILISTAIAVTSFAMSLFALPLINVAGTGVTMASACISFIPMLLGDILVECYGKKKGIIIPSVVYGIQLIFFSLGALASLWMMSMPEVFAFTSPDNITAFLTVFSIQSTGSARMFGAGIVAYYASVVTNALVMWKLKDVWKNSDNNMKLFARAIFSTLAGQLVDNFLFLLLGLYTPDALYGINSMKSLFTSLGWMLLFETCWEIIIFPVTLVLVKKINKLEVETVDTIAV